MDDGRLHESLQASSRVATKIYEKFLNDVRQRIGPLDQSLARKLSSAAAMIMQTRIQLFYFRLPSWDTSNKPKILSMIATLKKFIDHLTLQYQECQRSVADACEHLPYLGDAEGEELLKGAGDWKRILEPLKVPNHAGLEAETYGQLANLFRALVLQQFKVVQNSSPEEMRTLHAYMQELERSLSHLLMVAQNVKQLTSSIMAQHEKNLETLHRVDQDIINKAWNQQAAIEDMETQSDQLADEVRWERLKKLKHIQGLNEEEMELYSILEKKLFGSTEQTLPEYASSVSTESYEAPRTPTRMPRGFFPQRTPAFRRKVSEYDPQERMMERTIFKPGWWSMDRNSPTEEEKRQCRNDALQLLSERQLMETPPPKMAPFTDPGPGLKRRRAAEMLRKVSASKLAIQT